METLPPIESMDNRLSPEELGERFNTEDWFSFQSYLRKQVKADPSIRFNIVADWVSINKAEAAKELVSASKYHMDSITIRATRQQYEEGVNIFMSGVKWEEI